MTDARERKRQKAVRRNIRNVFDVEALRYFCTQPAAAFHDWGDQRTFSNGSFYYYQDNGADVLGIAHLDSVQTRPRFTMTEINGEPCVWSPTLDDRLGAYVICHLLPRLGVKTDWLLTIGEESANSSAGEFDSDRQYNWMFQFDRMGTDVVMYQYETPDLRQLVKATGAWVGTGSFSDISTLDHLGCAGFNWGVGYEDYHGPRAHAWLNDTWLSVSRFVGFWNDHKSVYMPHRYHPHGRAYGHGFSEPDWWERLNPPPRPRACPHCHCTMRRYWDKDTGSWYWCDDCNDIFEESDLEAS
jgi:hypothetical protein